MVRFFENFLLLDRLNVLRADIHCVLGNGIGRAAQSTQSVTLYMTVNILPLSLHNSPIVRGDSPAGEAAIPERVQSPVSEHALPLSHHQPVEAGKSMPQNREDMSHASTKDPHLALLRTDESMKRIPIDGSNTWEKAVERIKWVMDTLGPIAEVRVISFCVLGQANLQIQLSPFAKMAHGLLLAIPKARPFLLFSEQDAHTIFVLMVGAP